MSVLVSQLAREVIAAADREHPADAVLRERLKAARGLSRAEARDVSRLVFAYFRWLGWMNPALRFDRQFGLVLELAERFLRSPDSFQEAELARAIPDWTWDVMEVSPAWLRTLQSEPRLWLRARRGQAKSLAAKLGDCRSADSALLSDCLEYRGQNDLFRTAEFHAGEFELQDIHSQMVSLLCDPKPGEIWWDACAGEGGKTLHLSELMENKGLIWASDRAAWRLQRLKRRSARAGVFNYRAAFWDGGPKLPTKTQFDGVLVDAPCSGVGTWQRNPHARWTTAEGDVRALAARQRDLLATVASAVKPGGKLVYAVCTLTRTETVEVANAFQERFLEFHPLALANPIRSAAATHPLWLWPQISGGNGMFLAAWRKRRT